MKKWLMAAALAVLMAGNAQAFDTMQMRFGIVGTQDDVRTVLKAAGEPTRKVDLVNKFGVKLAERWEYDFHNKTVYLVIRNGTVQEIWDNL